MSTQPRAVTCAAPLTARSGDRGRRAPAAGVLLVALALASGCAGPDERHAFDQWMNEHDHARPGQPMQPAAATDFPAVAPAALPAGPASLEACLDEALRHHPLVEAARQEWKSALERVPQARAIADPKVQFRYNGLSQENEYAVSQMLPWPQKLDTAAAMAVENANAARQRYRLTQLTTAQQVREAYAELVYVDQAIHVMQRNLALMTSVEEATLALYRAGRTMQAMVLRAQSQRERMDTDLQSMRDMRQPAASRLAAAMGRASPLPDLRPADLPPAAPPPHEETILRLLRLHSPELDELRHMTAQARQSIRMARLENLPEIELGAGYMEMLGMNQAGGPTVMLSVSLPVYREKYDAMRRQALADFGAATHRLAGRDLQLADELRMRLFNLREADRRIDLLAHRLVPRASQILDATLAQYRAGDGDLEQVLMAQKEQLDIDLALLRARADRFQRFAQLDTLTAGQLTRPDHTSSPSPAPASPASTSAPASTPAPAHPVSPQEPRHE